MKHIHTFDSFLNESKGNWKVAYAGKGFYGVSNGGKIEGEMSKEDAEKEAEKRNSANESHYAFLGGNSNFTDDEMRKNVVEPVLGKKYDAYIMFDGPSGEYDKMKAKYAKNSDSWENIWRSDSYQSYASISPDKKVIKAAVFAKGGIVGAIYVKK